MGAYLKFHQLERSPFEGAESAQLVLATEALRKAFAEIKTGLDEGSPRICMSGGAGIGKSSLARALPKLLSKDAVCALIRDPSHPWARVKASIAKQLRLEAGQLSRASLVTARRGGRSIVIVIDQAEKLPTESLEHLDMVLGYRDDAGAQLVQCVLLASLEGAPRGEDVPLLWWLDKLTTRQLTMTPIPPAGLRSYVDKHLKKAGARASIFDNGALLAIHRYTGGVPGAVSALCEQLLDRAAEAGAHRVTAALVARAFGEPPEQGPGRDPLAPEESLIDHSNTPPTYELERPQQSAPLPSFGEARSARRPPPRAPSREPESESEPELELQVQQGLLPMEDTDDRGRQSDFSGPRARTGSAASAPRVQTHRSRPSAAPGGGRSTRLVRKLISLAVLAVLAAVAHAWWRTANLDDYLARYLAAVRSKATASMQRPSVPAAEQTREDEATVPPLVPPADRELALRSLALEDTQGRDEDPHPNGLTADLRLRPEDTAPVPPATEAPAEDLSLKDLYHIAEEEAEEEKGEPEEAEPWTQQAPENAPAAPASRR